MISGKGLSSEAGSRSRGKAKARRGERKSVLACVCGRVAAILRVQERAKGDRDGRKE